MQIWLGIVDRQRGVKRDDGTALADVFLPFAPHVRRSDVWISPQGRVGLWVWDNGPETFPAGLAATREGAVSLSGYVIENGELLTPAELAERLAVDRGDVVTGLGGVHTIVRATPDSLEAWNTPARLEQVYWASRRGRTIVSNRALAAHLVAQDSKHPEYDPAFLQSLLSAGFPTTDHTPFMGVSLLAPDSRLKVTARGARVGSNRSRPDAGAPEETLTRALTESVAFIPRVDGSPRSAVTGGKDSRLIAAVLAAAGVDFSGMTGGLDEHPDMILGAKVCEILGIPHIRTRAGVDDPDRRPTHLAVHVLSDSCRRLFGSDATHPVFELISRDVRVPSAPGVVLGGQGGELLRGGYAKKPVVRHRDAHRSLRKVALRHADHLTRSAGRGELNRLNRWLAVNFEARDPSQSLWRYYLRYRAGRWAAAGYAAASVGRPRVWPYFDARVVRAITTIEPDRRIDERTIVSVLGRLAPQLLTLPLVGGRWQFESSAPADDDQSGWAARAPLLAPPGRASFDWRFHFSSGLGDLMLETIQPTLDRAELEGTLDSDAITTLLDRLRTHQLDGDRLGGHFAWMLFSVALLLSDRWLDPEPPKDVIRFPIAP